MDEFPLIFFSLFLFNKTLLLTNIWVFLATPVCPSSALGSQDGYFQVPCAPGAQHDIVPLLPKLCEAGVQQEGWDGLGRAFCPQFRLQEAVRSLQGFLLAGVRGECAVCWICKQGSRHQRKRSPGRMKSHPRAGRHACAGAHGAAELCFSAQPRLALHAAGFGFTE